MVEPFTGTADQQTVLWSVECRKIQSHGWNLTDNEGNKQNLGFYTLLPSEEDRQDNPQVRDDSGPPRWGPFRARIERWINGSNGDPDKLLLYEPKGSSASNIDYIKGNMILEFLRRYVLVIVDDIAPANAYVACAYQGKWYYIDAGDEISQSNFNLVSLFLTMMAAPPTTSPISTTISVGGG